MFKLEHKNNCSKILRLVPVVQNIVQKFKASRCSSKLFRTGNQFIIFFAEKLDFHKKWSKNIFDKSEIFERKKFWSDFFKFSSWFLKSQVA